LSLGAGFLLNAKYWLELSILFGSFSKLLFPSFAYLCYSRLNNNLKRSHLANKITFSQTNRNINIAYTSGLTSKNLEASVDNFYLKHVTSDKNYNGDYYLLLSASHSFILINDNSGLTKFNLKLLNEIFNKRSSDRLVESCIIDHQHHTKNQIDTRDSIAEVVEKLKYIGVAKAEEVSKYLEENFNVKNLTHVKLLGDYEIHSICLFLRLDENESKKLTEQLDSIRNERSSLN